MPAGNLASFTSARGAKDLGELQPQFYQITNFFLNIYLYYCHYYYYYYVYMCACRVIRGRFLEVGSLLPPCELQGLNSGHKA